MNATTASRSTSDVADANAGRWLTRPRVLATIAGLWLTFVAAVMVTVGALTGFAVRRLYAVMARAASFIVLRLYGIRLVVVGVLPFPRTQTIYISNHTSTLDIFILVALGLPRCRFFLSGFVRKYIPLGAMAWMMGTFFTVPQDRPDERRRIFAAAETTLRTSGESVYLSPEGARITTGQIGHFNKGAFHLATNLHAPIVPLYFHIPREIDPGRGFDARPGVVTVDVLPAIDTRDWVLDDLESNVARVREIFIRRHSSNRGASPLGQAAHHG